MDTKEYVQKTLETLITIRSVMVQERFDIDSIQNISATIHLVEQFERWQKLEQVEDPQDAFERAMKVVK